MLRTYVTSPQSVRSDCRSVTLRTPQFVARVQEVVDNDLSKLMNTLAKELGLHMAPSIKVLRYVVKP